MASSDQPQTPSDRPTVIDTATLRVDRWEDPTRGNITWQTIFSSELTPTSGLTLGIAELPADGTVSNQPHRHQPAEVYFVLSGDGVVVIDGQSTPIHQGVAVFIPGNAEHSLRATGSQPMRLLYGFATDTFDDVEYVYSNPADE